MGADTVISGVVRAVLPYAALAGAGFVGYMWLDKKGYLNGIKDGIKGTVDTISEVPSKLVDTIKDRTGVDNFANGDWIGGAQKIVRNIPIVNLGEKGFNAAKDWIEDKLPDNPIPEIGSGGPIEFPKIDIPEVIPEVTPQVIPEVIDTTVKATQEIIPESVWTDTPLKYVPAVAIRNAITSSADNIGNTVGNIGNTVGNAIGNIGNTVGNAIGNTVKKFKFW